VPTLSTPFDQWTFATIQQLITDRVTESVTVEFKRDMPHAQPRDREEVAKDISSMANSAGGWIIYGVDEKPVGNPPVKVA
jgi:predicted HTH transcriptional regulator